MKPICNTIFLISFLISSASFANDVIMATTEDLKEFDNLIVKDPKAGPQDANTKPPQGQPMPPSKNVKGERKDQNRLKFETDPSQEQGAKNRKRGKGPRGERPPAGQDTRPPPGSLPPPPPPR